MVTAKKVAATQPKKPKSGGARDSVPKPSSDGSPGPTGNTAGTVVNKTKPNLSGSTSKPSVKPQTKKEDEFHDWAKQPRTRAQTNTEADAQMAALEKANAAKDYVAATEAKDKLAALAQQQEGMGGVKAGTTLGNMRQGKLWDILSALSGRGQARSKRSASPSKDQPPPKRADTTGGMRVDGTEKIPCMVGAYNKIVKACNEKGGQAHHIVADKTFGTTNRKQREKGIGRLPKTPDFNGPSICLQGNAKVPGTDHNTAHEADEEVKKLGQRTDNGPAGTAPIGQITRIYKKHAIAARPDCKDLIDKAVKDGMKDVDKNQSGRTTDSKPNGDAKAHLERGGKADQGNIAPKPKRRR